MPLGAALAMAVALAAQAAAAASAVTGTPAHRERMALPPEAVLEVTLEDASRADAPAAMIARTRTEPAGQAPAAFTLDDDPARIDPRLTYAVRARVRDGDRLLFTTTALHPVLTRGHGSTVELLLQRVATGAETAPAVPGGLPASFEGLLPCADCPGIRHHLDLLADGSYQLRLAYLERASVFDEIGRWILGGYGTTLSLHGGGERPMQLRLLESGELELLDIEGKPIESQLNHRLRRTAAFAPIEPQLAMRGMFSYMADAGRFKECLTGRDLPVAQLEDNAALERAYLERRREPNEPLLVTLAGRIALLPPMEGPGPVPQLVVERFQGIWPGETCGAPFATATFENTYWKLTRLREAPVQVAHDQREPHLIFRDGNAFAGSGGCNNIGGSFTKQDGSLTLGKGFSTMMACPEGMEQERKLLDTLEEVRSWRIIGEHLELYDAEGQRLARFQAVALR